MLSKPKRIVVLNTDNEEYLLQWWLPHHANKFDEGVILDFGDDGTEELCKKYVPNWTYKKVEIVPEDLNNYRWDDVISKVENVIHDDFPRSWIITLSATEFLIGNMDFLDNYIHPTRVLIPSFLMNDHPDLENVEPDPNIPLLKQRTHGVHYYFNDWPWPEHSISKNLFIELKLENKINPLDLKMNCRWMRSIHNFKQKYTETSLFGAGRHYWKEADMTKELVICHMNYSPFTENFIKRKLNVQKRLTKFDYANHYGTQHVTDIDKIYKTKRFYDQLTVNLVGEINRLEYRRMTFQEMDNVMQSLK